MISLSEGHWSIRINGQRDTVYMSTLTDNIDSPKGSGTWESTKLGKDPVPVIDVSHGSLQNADDLPKYSQDSNIQILYHRPITTCILLIIFIIFFLCLTNRIDRNMMLISYDSIVNKDEYFRIFTASLSHFDWMHVIFNTMSLYEIGEIELVLGSGKYLYLNVDLIVITMIICLFVQHILITKFNKTEMIQQQSLGYSCVLFAWMVVFSVRLRKFCPIFLFPSLCFSTYVLKIPFTAGLPVNFGPIVLLVFTKLILPQSSFLGHLSGIIIGYPLAWNLLNWVTPSVLIGMVFISVIFKLKLYVWTISVFETSRTTESFEEFVPFIQFLWMRVLMICALILSGLFVLIILSFGWKQILHRVAVLFLVWSSVFAIQCSWLSDQNSSLKASCDIILTALILVLITFLLDICTLGGLIGSQPMLNHLVWLLSIVPYSVIVIIQVLTVICEGLIAVALWYGLRDLRVSAVWLESLRLDPMSIDYDMNTLGIKWCTSLFRRVNDMITPRAGHRLGFSRLPIEDPHFDQTSSANNRLTPTYQDVENHNQKSHSKGPAIVNL